MFGPILFSRLHDTAETIEAVKAHNAAWDTLCGSKPLKRDELLARP